MFEENLIEFNQDNPIPKFTPIIRNNNVYICGNLVGVSLQKRSNKDLHICFRFIVEDDGCWYEWDNNVISCDWWSDLNKVLKVTKKWLEQNTMKDKYNSYYFKQEML